MRFLSILCLICAVSVSTPGRAHEVWFELSEWTLEAQESFSAKLINGHDFEGFQLSWDPRRIQRAEMWHGDEGFRLVGRAGDRPAIRTEAGQDGLLTLVYQPDYSTIVYEDFEKFAAFAQGKGQDATIVSHQEHGLPDEAIREAYTRFVKVLAAVGPGEGSDRAYGLQLEIVALDNPYTADLAAPLRFQVLYKDAPLAGNQVMLLARDGQGEVSKVMQQTDASGTVSFEVAPGHTYLVDSVILRRPDAELAERKGGAIWESLWASLTFAVRGDDQ